MKRQISLALAAALLLSGVALSGVTMASAATMSTATSSNTTPSNTTSAAPKAGDTLSLSGTQQKTAWNDLYMGSLDQTTPSGFSATVGAVVPNSVTTAPVTSKAASDVPALKPYSFAMVQKKLVIVNPSDHKIADVISG